MKKHYIEEYLFGSELINWQMKMNEPLKARKLTDEEIVKLAPQTKPSTTLNTHEE